MTVKKHRLHEINLRELSAVTAPANQDSLILLHKVDDAATAPTGIVAKVKRWLTSWSKAGAAASDVQDAIDAVMANDAVTDKEAAIGEVVKEFRTAVVDNVSDDLSEDGVAKMLSEYTTKELDAEQARRKAKKDAPGSATEAHAEQALEDDDEASSDPADKARSKKGAGAMGGPDCKKDGDVGKAAAEQFAKLAEENRTLREAFAKAEAIREDAEVLSIAKAMIGSVAADPAKLAPIVKKADATERAALAEMFKGLNAVLKDNGIFKVMGSDSAIAPSAQDELEKVADELRKADPTLTAPAAFAKACRLHTDLYAEVSKAQTVHTA